MTGAKPAPAGDAKRSTGLWVGASLGILVTLAVLFATLASGGPEKPTDEGGPVAATAPLSTTTNPFEAVVSGLGPLPEGDYTQFCQVVNEASDPSLTELTPELFTDAISEIDFDALIAASPEGLRPQLVLLRDSREQLLALMGTIDSMDELTVADFPEGVPGAILAMVQAYKVKCS